MRKCQNQFCGKILKPKEGKTKIDPRRIFCDSTCASREISLKNYHIKDKFDLDKKKYHKDYYKKWYQKNKETQKENVLRDFLKNKSKWRERGYINRECNRTRIWKIIGKVCKDCGEKAKEMNHLKYDFPKRSNRLRGDKHLEYLKWYSQYLEPLCMKCHKIKKRSRYKIK